LIKIYLGSPHIQMQCLKIARRNWALANLRILVKNPTLKCAYYVGCRPTSLSTFAILCFNLGPSIQ